MTAIHEPRVNYRRQLEAYRRQRHFRKLARQVSHVTLFILFLWLAYQCVLEALPS